MFVRPLKSYIIVDYLSAYSWIMDIQQYFKLTIYCHFIVGFQRQFTIFTIFTQPLHSGRIWHKVIFKRSLTGLNSEHSFSKTSSLAKVEEPSLSHYLPIAGGRIFGFIPFPSVLVLREMQSVSSRIWTRVAVSISYEDNHNTTGTSCVQPPPLGQDMTQGQFF